MADQKLAGKVAVVTGASRGIGAAIARRLAADGAKVIVHYNTGGKEADAVVAAIKKVGGEAVAVRADLGDPAAVPGLFDAAEKAFGTVTVLVNNAATQGKPTPAPEVDAALFDELFHANVRGPVLCIAEFARRAGSGGGRVINTTSGQARTPMPAIGLYAGTKGAMESITRAFAGDLGPQGITVNGVAPGATATESFKSHVSAAKQKDAVANTALGRLGEPEDIAAVVAFLCSDDAGWITGQIIDVNGGLRRS